MHFVLVNDFDVYQNLLLIFVAVSVIELIFVSSVLYGLCTYSP